MHVRNLLKIALIVVGLTAVTVFAQKVDKKNEIDKAGTSAAAKSRAFAFEEAKIMGYLDEPTIVTVIDRDDAELDQILLTRSFKEALKENVDKEAIERSAR